MLKLMCFESVSNHLILCQPLLLLSSIFPRISIFSNESTLLLRLPKYWSVSFSISLSSEYSVLISFKIDWFDLLAVQQTLKSLLNHYNLRESILWCYSLYGPTLISVHDYWKTIALIILTLVRKAMSLLYLGL